MEMNGRGCVPIRPLTKTGGRPDLALGRYFANLWPRAKNTIFWLEFLRGRRKKTNAYGGLACVAHLLILKIPHRGRQWYFRFHCSFNGRRIEYLYNSGRESNRLLCVTSSIWENFLWDWLDTYLFQSTWTTAGYHTFYILKMISSLLQERPASFLMTRRFQVFNCLLCSQLPPVAWNIDAKVKNCKQR